MFKRNKPGEEQTRPKREINPDWWRDLLARLPLPTLALGASYGVYEFNSRYMPLPFAIITAGSFEATYIGLSVIRNLPEKLRNRARAIAWGTVAVSILYNTFSGLFSVLPGLLTENFDLGTRWPKLVFETVFALMHGVPLALVSFLVADLLLHLAIELTRRDQEKEAAVQTVLDPDQLVVQISAAVQQNIAVQIGNLRRETTRSIEALAGEVGARFAEQESKMAAAAVKTDPGPVQSALKETAHAFATAPVVATPKLALVGAVGAADSGHDQELEEIQAKARELELPDPTQMALAEQEEWAYRLKNEYGWFNREIGKWLSVSENTAKKRWQDYQKRAQQ